MTPNTFLVVAGPSCAGKSPLVKAIRRLHPDLMAGYATPILYHTRKPRPGEVDGVDYHFRTRKELKGLRDRKGFEVFKARDQLQAVDIGEFNGLIARGNVVYEGNVAISLALKAIAAGAGANVVDVFLSPLGLDEVRRLARSGGFKEQLTEMMRRRLLRRSYAKSAHLSLPDLQDIEERAATARDELAEAHAFSHVIANHDGEDSDHWTVFREPVGDAGRTVRALASILRGSPDGAAERWPSDLFGQ